ncbi:polyphosphate kinase 2 family protein [Bacteroidota bacterium]
MSKEKNVYQELIFNPSQNQKLSDFDASYIGEFKNKKQGIEELKNSSEKLSELQEVLYAYDKYSLLIVFQGMDAAGKDGTIKHVMSRVNPMGCSVKSFKKPSDEELDHTYLWRCYKALPERGRIGIFNRSYYEEVLVTRVHPEILKNQKLPHAPKDSKNNKSFWDMRYRQINEFENYLVDNGMTILKFFLNLSKDEQKNRFMSRIENPRKHWKISLSDFKERKYWDDYQYAIEQMLINTSTDIAPWYLIPADNKWFMRAAISDIIIATLEKMNLKYPGVSEEKKSEIQKAKKWLLNDNN